MDQNNKVSTATPIENAEAFERARRIVEKITPLLKGVDPFDEAMALQLLIARSGLRMKRKPEEVLAVLAHNMESLMMMWESAFIEANKSVPPGD